MTADSTWKDVEARLDVTIAGLVDGGHVVVGEPAGTAAPRGLLRRRQAPPPRPYAQAALRGSWLYAECIGATAFGGDWEVTPEQDAAIRGAGWLTPDQDDETGTRPSYPNYWRTLPVERRSEVVTMMVAALQALGVEPAALEWDRGV